MNLLSSWPRLAFAAAALLVMLLHASGLVPLEPVRRLDAVLYDIRLRATLPETLDERIVIVDIDEKSMAEFGRWPWGRDRMAQLMRELTGRQQVRLVGFDIVFAEPDRSSGLPQLERLAQHELKDQPQFQAELGKLRRALDHDALFADALRGQPVVLGYYFSSDREARKSGALPQPVMERSALGGRPVRFTRWDGYAANLPLLARAAPQAGFFNSLQDGDGVVRSVALVAEHEGHYYESLALAMFRRLLGQPQVVPGFPQERWLPRSYQGLESLQLHGPGQRVDIPVDARVGALVPYRGPGGPEGGSFRYLSAAELLNGRLAAGQLKDKIVLVGTTAPGMYDLRVTPVGEVYPGVEAHANLLSGLLDGRLPVQPDYALGYEVLMLIVMGAGLTLLLARLAPWPALLATAGVLVGMIGLDFWLYSAHQLVMPLASMLLLVALLFAAHVAYGYFFEGRSRRELDRLFAGHLAAPVMDEMARSDGRWNKAAISTPLTVLVCDLRHFTQLSQQLPAEQVPELLRCFLGAMTEVVQQHRGTLDQYVGDSLVAFWGAPLADPHHAAQAVEAARAMVAALAPLNAELRGRGLPEVTMGIGLSTGMSWVGDLGSELRPSYSALGEPVELALRLEALSRSYGLEILASEGTRDAANQLPWQEVDRILLKGRERPLTLYTPLPAAPAEDKALASELMAWHMALKAYRAQDWDQADVQLLNLQRLNPGKRLYSLFAYRVSHLRKHPPAAGWDGAFSADSK
ncbi:adenylate/guanylate cyclase domain-containing protein [Aquabacterium sp. A7-Y]|uniref:CHASE2 domain-containing protein n=1 Tax=Aquabacterium sp. A7-Y TaxID=1349605 RepID=UPI00223DDDEC|nr:adenylate/guanylate cyclase domain-containing protein [Aquabacterium sp. A7-Y]MCW7538969.1 adenylate/guanylate cyclase domain-containing protein [Aquabacterium sp. A7-Y]